MSAKKSRCHVCDYEDGATHCARCKERLKEPPVWKAGGGPYCRRCRPYVLPTWGVIGLDHDSPVIIEPCCGTGEEEEAPS
jgi:hypothetical protein